MTDPTKTPAEAPHFETSDVEANLAMEQGLGVGARELAAQRDAGGVVIQDVEPGTEEEDDIDGDTIERNAAVQGSPD